MTELTREDLYFIKTALLGAKEQIENLMGANVGTANAEIIEAYRLIDAVLYPTPAVPAAKVETAPVAAKAKKAPKAKPELTAGQESALNTAYLNEKGGRYLDRDIRRDVFDKLRDAGMVESGKIFDVTHLSEKALRYLGLDDVQIAKHHVARLTPKLAWRWINVHEARNKVAVDRMAAVSESIDWLNQLAEELTRWEIRAGIAK